MKNILRLLTILILTISISSCTKTGPQGPAGANGTNGVDGTNGTNGTNGADGNANVQSFTLNENSGDWYSYADGITGFTDWEVDMSVPAITQSILDKGAVLIYTESNGNFYQLPFSQSGVDLGVGFRVGTIGVFLS